MQLWVVSWCGPWQRIEGKPHTHRGVPGQQIATVAAQKPGARLPMHAGRIAGDRQDVTDYAVEPFVEQASEAGAFLRILQPWIPTVDVGGQSALSPLIVK